MISDSETEVEQSKGCVCVQQSPNSDCCGLSATDKTVECSASTAVSRVTSAALWSGTLSFGNRLKSLLVRPSSRELFLCVSLFPSLPPSIRQKKDEEKRVNQSQLGVLQGAPNCISLFLLILCIFILLSHTTCHRSIFTLQQGWKRWRKKQGAREQTFFIVYARGVGDGKLLIRRAGRVERADIFIANWITRLTNAHRALAVIFQLCGTNTAKLHANYFLMRWILELSFCAAGVPETSGGDAKRELGLS